MGLELRPFMLSYILRPTWILRHGLGKLLNWPDWTQLFNPPTSAHQHARIIGGCHQARLCVFPNVISPAQMHEGKEQRALMMEQGRWFQWSNPIMLLNVLVSPKLLSVLSDSSMLIWSRILMEHWAPGIDRHSLAIAHLTVAWAGSKLGSSFWSQCLLSGNLISSLHV